MLENIPSRRSHRRVFRMETSQILKNSSANSISMPEAATKYENCSRPAATAQARMSFWIAHFALSESSVGPPGSLTDPFLCSIVRWIRRLPRRRSSTGIRAMGTDSYQSLRTAYYQQFVCRFDGIEKDLRPKIEEWPDLVHDSDYSFCNRLGSEANRLDLDGLVTQSARHHGSNLAAFRRRAVDNPVLQGRVAITYDPTTGKLTARDIEA